VKKVCIGLGEIMSLADKLSFAKKPIGVAPVRPTTFAPSLPGAKPTGRMGVIKKMISAFKPKSVASRLANPTAAAPTQLAKPALASQDEKKPGLLKKAMGLFKQAPKAEVGPSAGVDLGELAVILAKHLEVPELQAELARDSLQFELEGQLWEFEKVGQEEKDQVIIKTGFLLSFKNLEKVQLVTIMCVAETLVKQFEGSLWVDNNTGRLEMGWRLGRVDKLSEKSSIKKFEMAYAFVTSTKAQFLESFGEAAFRKPE
jgi:hypothetical protein